MDAECANCGDKFVLKCKSYKRINIEKNLENKSIRNHFSDLQIPLNSSNFICSGCHKSLKDALSLKEKPGFNSAFKRQRTPHQTPRVVKTARKTWKKTLHTHFLRSKYLSLLLSLYQRKPGQRALTTFIKLQIRKEITAYNKKSNSLSAKVTQESLSSFSWETVLNELNEKLPLLYSFLCAAATTRLSETENLNVSGSKFGRCVPILGMASAVLLYGRQPRKYNFFQELCALEMWKCGADQKLFQCFQRLGICKGTAGAKGAVDRLRREFDSEIVQWKHDIEEMEKTRTLNETFESEQPMTYDSPDIWTLVPPNEIRTVEPSIDHEDMKIINFPASSSVADENTKSDQDMSLNYIPSMDVSPAERINIFTQHENDHEEQPSKNADDSSYSPPMDLSPTSEDRQWIRYPSNINTPSDLSLLLEPEDPIPAFEYETEETDNPGFCLVWDNVQLLSTTRHHAANQSNKMHMWALAFAVKNRLNFNHLTTNETLRARNIPIHLFLPTKDDYVILRHRMEIIVSRIIKSHLDVFKNCDILQHVQHQYSFESAEKSRIINLGVIDADPSSVQGTITIMEHLQQYVPVYGSKLHTIPTHGDGLSVERMRDSKAVRAPSETAKDRLEGLEPVPQEWHKRVLVMQDTYNKFYQPNSGANRGTLFHIRNAFGYRNVTKDVIKSFNYNADLLEFTTRGLTSLFAKQLFEEIHNHENVELDTVLELIASKVVETVWVEFSQESVDAVLDAEDDDDDDDDMEEYYEYCFCKEERDEEMIQCSNNRCFNGNWFHISCASIASTQELADKDWWCSPECKNTRRSIFCSCKTLLEGEEIVQCVNGMRCIGHRYYHMKCTTLTRKPGRRWTCMCCSQVQERQDHTFNYSCALLYEGLKDLATRDMVRENDGEAMISAWRLLMPQFWEKGHFKYLIIAHKLLSDVLGFQPQRISQEIIWNRTANLRGGEGHNIPLDLVNEFLNRDFKENLKRSKGQYSSVNVARTSQFVGTLGRDLDNVFQSKVCGTWISASCQSDGDTLFDEDVQKFITMFEADNLFIKVPGREHSSFPAFEHDITIKNPGKFKQRLKKYSKKLDVYRQIMP